MRDNCEFLLLSSGLAWPYGVFIMSGIDLPGSSRQPGGQSARWRLWLLRFAFSLAVALFAWQIQRSELSRDTTFIAFFEQELFDRASAVRENTVGGAAPSAVLLLHKMRLSPGEAAEEPREVGDVERSPPTAPESIMSDEAEISLDESSLIYRSSTTSLDIIRKAMVAGLNSDALIIVIDVDLEPIGFPRALEERRAFRTFLKEWAGSPKAPLTVFQRSVLRQDNGALPVLAATHFDDIVENAPNLAFASAGAAADQDGVVRQVAFVQCVQQERSGPIALPHASLFALSSAALRSRMPLERARQARTEVRGAIANVCPEPNQQKDLWELLSSSFKERKVRFELAGQRFYSLRGMIDFHINAQVSRPAAVTEQNPIMQGLDNFVRAGMSGGSAAIVSKEWGSQPAIVAPPDAGFLFAAEEPKFPIAPHAIFILASTQELFEDFHETPLGEVPGAIIVANAARSLVLHGPLRELSATAVITALVGITLLLNIYYWSGAQLHAAALRRQERLLRTNRGHLANLPALLTGPVALKLFASSLIFLLSVWASILMMEVGYWEAFVVPALAASLLLALEDPIETFLTRDKDEVQHVQTSNGHNTANAGDATHGGPGGRS